MSLPVRVRASSVVLRDGHILLIEYDSPDLGHHFNLPGGGVERGESVREAARRELWEETGLDATVGRLLLIWEVVVNESERLPGKPHGLDFVFLCAAVEGSQPRLPDTPDADQTAVRWIFLAALESVRLLPPYADAIRSALDTSDGCVPFYGQV